ncbi:hypothetical protein NVP1101O_085 [Vibrio phage 1.101.O._10N.261.45.C6]|nr:hypothetical protein NVP1101O_085 [Vibrio phage 1.101.O._10N.261.45.C6]
MHQTDDNNLPWRKDEYLLTIEDYDAIGIYMTTDDFFLDNMIFLDEDDVVAQVDKVLGGMK